ncbi:hypothetical protein F4821DRAFT_191611 [Hypoxylon rubiginosum]|uniref:Uncharacterized protein n=1 Tax=Hypoxylon rubiginosum TaxID=110542 RepID=A0ACC0CSV9_9PEZI|nr:hypothetical protein F4821DRAFT_191611 [Hypoxylon rubiginosum]
MSFADIIQSSEESGDLETFGVALQSINFWGPSEMNPRNMQENCVSVAIAHMEFYETVHDLWNAVYQKDLVDKALDFDQMLDLLKHTGMKYEWKKYSSQIRQDGTIEMSAYDNFARDAQGLDQKLPSLIAFMRFDATGHAVNLERATPDYQSLADVAFKDYQHDSMGADARADAQQAESIILLWKSGFVDTSQSQKLNREWTRRIILESHRMSEHGGRKPGREFDGYSEIPRPIPHFSDNPLPKMGGSNQQ